MPPINAFYGSALLQCFIVLRYTERTNATSFAGITTPDHQKAFSHSNVNVAFFVSMVKVDTQLSLILWELIRAKAGILAEGCHLFGLEQSKGSCGYSFQHPPHSITTVWEGCKNLNKKVFIMAKKAHKPNNQAARPRVDTPEQCFQINPSIDLSNPISPLYTLLVRAKSLLLILQNDGHDLTQGFTLDQMDVMNVLWLLEGQLEQGVQILEGVQQHG